MSHPKRSSYSRFAITLLAVVLLVCLAAACGKKEDKVVGEYEGGQVTASEFKQYKTFMKVMNPYYASIIDEDSVQESVLSSYIGMKILSARATEEAKTQGTEEANTNFTTIKDQIEALDADTKKSIEDIMKEGDLTYDQMKSFITTQTIASKDADLKVTDEQISTYYDENKDSFKYATVRHILIGFTDKEGKTREKADALKLAQEVKQKLVDGGDWTALAKEYTDDTATAENGGLYEKANPDQWVEEFKNAANTQPLNEIGDPVETEYGYHVIKVEARGTSTLEESKQTILSTLSGEIIDKFMTDELPGLIKSMDVPKPSASPSASASATASASPSASPSASAPASPEASASPSASAGQ
ncbi:peptidylprolyl isomerase [Cohnella thailandensis]|uniref:Peptidylprolyl isomerase n=1 Tax=Cohnella thailandensis TaxID=557557 RepID=A0A841T8V4_9BACL|nr:peptidylprolyl isomerase [Cohnella thailandensis]MBB6638287.1 peptidylprolyl isomerase [Cohnella thailandensis]MBP1977709.1 foldase protein PrsA [Cohnella thailandensis]